MTARRAPIAIGTALALAACGALIVAALAAPWLTSYSPIAVVSQPLEPPSWAHLLGTDRAGRDVLTRILHGARVSLGGAMLSLAFTIVVGVALGSMAGFYGGWVDTAVMRLVDAVLAIPALVLALAVAGLFQPGLLPAVAALSLVWWARHARLARALVLSYRERPYIEAARALGASDGHLLWRHLLPHMAAPVLALGALEFGTLILALSSLSFIGLGVQPPLAEWGAMINEAKSVFLVAPHVLLAPGAAVAISVLAVNVLGEHVGERLGGVEAAPPPRHATS